MSVQLLRKSRIKTLTVADGGTTSDVLVLDGAAIGMIFLPASFEGTSVTFTVSSAYDGTYVGYEDAAGNAVALVVESSKAYALPEGLFGAPFAKLVVSQQTGAASIIVTLKG